jgi:hypothetical protein
MTLAAIKLPVDIIEHTPWFVDCIVNLEPGKDFSLSSRHACKLSIGKALQFRQVSRHDYLVGEQGLTPQAVAQVVQAAVRAAKGEEVAATVAAHSLRSGMVTVAATVGIPVSEIMGVTRHTSVATLYGNTGKARLRPEQWLLVEWPASDAEPSKYFLSTLPEDTPINELVGVAHQRWRIERDYQDLKQDLGLGHYEGRG